MHTADANAATLSPNAHSDPATPAPDQRALHERSEIKDSIIQVNLMPNLRSVTQRFVTSSQR